LGLLFFPATSLFRYVIVSLFRSDISLEKTSGLNLYLVCCVPLCNLRCSHYPGTGQRGVPDRLRAAFVITLMARRVRTLSAGLSNYKHEHSVHLRVTVSSYPLPEPNPFPVSVPGLRLEFRRGPSLLITAY